MKNRFALAALLVVSAGLLAACSSSHEENGIRYEQHHWYDLD